MISDLSGSSGGFSIRVTTDDISPDLAKKLSALKNPQPILRAMGTQLVSLTKRAFRDSSLRQTPWAPKRGGQASNLILKGVLISSIRITGITNDSVTIGSDRKYAAIHQLGGVIRPKKGKSLVFQIGGRTIFAKSVKIPARPFFPFLPDGSLAPVAQEPMREITMEAFARAL